MIYEKELCDKIIGCAIAVHKEMGSGYLEKLYEKALLIELEDQGLKAEAQYPVKVHYRGHLIGEYYMDIVVEDKVILELKTVPSIQSVHESQLLNYLNASQLHIGYIMNFACPGRLEFKRMIRT